MKVYELMEALSHMEAGADILLSCTDKPENIIANGALFDDTGTITVDFDISIADEDCAVLSITRRNNS